MKTDKPIITIEQITQSIYSFRGRRVMLDSDLADLYGVETRILLQAIKRNMERFPDDFMFHLNPASKPVARETKVLNMERFFAFFRFSRTHCTVNLKKAKNLFRFSALGSRSRVYLQDLGFSLQNKSLGT